MADSFTEALGSPGADQESGIGIAVNDLTGRFLLVNRAYCEITGYSEQDLISRTYQSITHPDDLRGNCSLARRVSTGEFQSIVYEKRYIRRDKSIIWVRNNLSMLHDNSGKPLRAIALSEPVTGRNPDEFAGRRFRLLSKTLPGSEEAERRRLARELHDSTGQLLAGIEIALARLQGSSFDAAQRDSLVAEALDLTRQCSREVRTLSYLLHPPDLEEFGLAGALQTYAEGFTRRTGIELKIDIPEDPGWLPHEVKTAIFRVVQEGLTNIHKHSGSRLAEITLKRRAGQIVLELLDWGCGIGRPPAGVGLAGMRERVRLLGGRLKISSSRQGTRIAAIFPLSGSNDEHPYLDRG